MTERETNIIKTLIDDYIGTVDYAEFKENFDSALNCNHICTSSCGNDRECDCDCGDMHIY